MPEASHSVDISQLILRIHNVPELLCAPILGLANVHLCYAYASSPFLPLSSNPDGFLAEVFARVLGSSLCVGLQPRNIFHILSTRLASKLLFQCSGGVTHDGPCMKCR
jgi:hypothetical protein